MASSADLAEVVTVGVASSADLAEVITVGVAPSADHDGDVTAGVTSMEECGERDVVLSDYVDNYDDYHYDCQYDCPDYYRYDEYDDCHIYDPEYDDYDDYHEYDDYGGYDDSGDYCGDVIASVTSMEEYQERDVILSNVVPPQTDPDRSSTKRGPAAPRPSLPCDR